MFFGWNNNSCGQFWDSGGNWSIQRKPVIVFMLSFSMLNYVFEQSH